MSRHSGMTAGARRAWGAGAVLFLVVLCALIGFSEWWAYRVNVPQYRGQERSVPAAAHRH